MATISTAQDAYSFVSQASVSATSYTALGGTTTAPSTNVLYRDNVPDNPNLIHMTPLVATALTSGTCGFRVTGYRRYYQAANDNFLYVPTVLASFNATLTTGTMPNVTVDGTLYNAFATVTQNVGQPASLLFSPGSASASTSEIASVVVDAMGCQIVTAQFIVPSGTYAMGLLWANL